MLLGSLPAREADSSGIDKAAYYLALEGTTKYGLQQAAKAILRGALGHVFFPNPAELRIQCDKAMEHPISLRNRASVYERMAREKIPDRPPLSEAEKERQNERMARFHAAYHAKDPEAEMAVIRAKYDPDLLAKVPDAPRVPLPAGMAQIGRKTA